MQKDNTGENFFAGAFAMKGVRHGGAVVPLSGNCVAGNKNIILSLYLKYFV